MEDSAAPSFTKRNKAKTNRARLSTSDEVPSTADEPEASPSTLATKLKNKHKARVKPKARLSFGGDDEEAEGDVFQVKKSNLSRSLALGSHPALPGVTLPANLDQASISPQASPIYSKEYLSELKASTPSTPATRAPATTYDSDMSFDTSEIAGALVENADELNNSTSIPSESSILAAKEKRERLRVTKAASDEDDFISLSVTKKTDVPSGPHPESRLMREEDEIGEGEDEYAEYTSAQERISLGKKAKKKEAANRRNIMKEMINDAHEEDEETMEWEQEQLRRGARHEIETPDKIQAKQVYKPAPIPLPTPIPVLDPAVARITQSLTELTTSHATSTASMTTLADERDVLETREKELRDMVKKAEEKRSWFVAFREWVESVATFLDEKYPLIEKLEEEHVSLLRERNEMIAKRRLQDDEDDLATFLASPPEPPRPEIEEVDELGRAIPHPNSSIVRKERQGFRISRRSRRVAKQLEEEGYSTDASLSPSDASDFQTAMSQLGRRVQNVLEDVRSDEFNDPEMGVAKWFGEWREKYSETYTGAYGGLGMVSAWEFWVRLEIVGWDPIADPRDLHSFAWYGSLYEYSRPRKADHTDDDEPELSPDGDLVSAMTSTAVVPRLCQVIRGGAFDPYSAKHLSTLVDLAEQIEATANNDKFEMLLTTVIASFREAVTTVDGVLHQYLQYNGTQFNPQAIPARKRFLARRLKLLNNMLRWRKYTGEKFGVGDLIAKHVMDCVKSVAESGWEVGGEEIIRKTIKLLPAELCPASLRTMIS